MVAAVLAVVVDVVPVAAEAADVEKREEGRGEDLFLPTSPSVAPVVLEEELSYVLLAAVAVVAVAGEAALFRGGQGEGETQLPLRHDDQMIHEEENLRHVSQILQEAYTCKKCMQDVYFIRKSNTILPPRSTLGRSSVIRELFSHWWTSGVWRRRRTAAATMTFFPRLPSSERWVWSFSPIPPTWIPWIPPLHLSSRTPIDIGVFLRRETMFFMRRPSLSEATRHRSLPGVGRGSIEFTSRARGRTATKFWTHKFPSWRRRGASALPLTLLVLRGMPEMIGRWGATLWRHSPSIMIWTLKVHILGRRGTSLLIKQSLWWEPKLWASRVSGCSLTAGGSRSRFWLISKLFGDNVSPKQRYIELSSDVFAVLLCGSVLTLQTRAMLRAPAGRREVDGIMFHGRSSPSDVKGTTN